MAFQAPYKIEIKHNQKVLTFGPRLPNEMGRDILAVKLALGLIEREPSGSSDSSSVALDSQNWFECGTGEGMSITQASKYDTKLKNAIINFQIQNQFLIVCYLLEKFALRAIIGQVGEDVEFNTLFNNLPEKYNRSLIRQIESTIILFDSELGILGEATLAVMHGWVPHTSISNKGYSHQNLVNYDRIYDVIHVALANELTNRLTQTYDDLVSAGICAPAGFEFNNMDKLRIYLEYVSSELDWTKTKKHQWKFWEEEEVRAFQFGVLEYYKKDPDNTESVLFAAARTVLDNMVEIDADFKEEIGSISSEEKLENLKRMYFPDPFIDPPPFAIDDERIGVFFETDFELRPESLPSNDEDVIKNIEQLALEEVFRHFDKPEIWYLNHSALPSGKNNEIEKVNSSFFGGSMDFISGPIHDGYYPYPEEVVSQKPELERDAMFSKYKEYSELKRRIEFNEKARRDAKKTVQDYNRPDSEYYEATGFVMTYDVDENTSRASPGTARRTIDDFYDSKNASIAAVMLQFPSAQFNKESFYVCSLKQLEQTSETTQKLAQHWRQIDELVTTVEPLIKFVEYRTPNLRPQQKYRALLYVNKRKLDLIVNSVVLAEQASSDTQRSSISTADSGECADDNVNQSVRRYQEYKSHAIRTRNEIVKKYREETKKFKYQNDYDSARLDLGEYGPFDLNDAFNPLGGGMVSGMAYTEKVFSKLIGEDSSLLSAMGITGTDLEQINQTLKDNDPLKTTNDGLPEGADSQQGSLNKIQINLGDLRTRVKIMAKDLKEAGEEIKKSAIKFDPGSNFRAEFESAAVQKFLIEFEAALSKVFEEPSEQTKITFEFERSKTDKRIGPKVGKVITYCSATAPKPSSEDDEGDDSLLTSKTDVIPVESFSKGNLNRPRTVNYISRILDMTTRYLPEGSAMKSFFEDSRGACKDLGIDLKKTLGISYIGKYTSGLKVTPDPAQESFEPVKEWWSDNFGDPFDEWVTTSSNNLKSSGLGLSINPLAPLNFSRPKGDNFSEADALALMGEACEWEDFYTAVFDKLDFASLMCDYIKCIKLPGFDIKLPSFHLPPLPKVPIIGWMGEIYKFFINQFGQIINRLLCTAGKLLIDKMAMPLCEEQLREFIAAGSSAGPIWNEALADSLLLTGFPGQKKEEAKRYFEDSVAILTGPELCACLRGEKLDQPTMRALTKLVGNRGLASELQNDEDIMNFFGVLGAYIPFEICNTLESPQLIQKDCEDSQDLISSIRNKLLSDDPNLSESELNNALDIARKNRDDTVDQLKAFSNSGLGSMAPSFFELGNPNAAVSDYPPYLKQEMENTLKAIFEPARSSYVSSLTSYIPSMRILSPNAPRAGDDGYKDVETMTLESALHQMSAYTHFVDRHISGSQSAIDRLEAEIREKEVEADNFQQKSLEDQARVHSAYEEIKTKFGPLSQALEADALLVNSRSSDLKDSSGNYVMVTRHKPFSGGFRSRQEFNEVCENRWGNNTYLEAFYLHNVFENSYIKNAEGVLTEVISADREAARILYEQKEAEMRKLLTDFKSMSLSVLGRYVTVSSQHLSRVNVGAKALEDTHPDSKVSANEAMHNLMDEGASDGVYARAGMRDAPTNQLYAVYDRFAIYMRFLDDSYKSAVNTGDSGGNNVLESVEAGYKAAATQKQEIIKLKRNELVAVSAPPAITLELASLLFANFKTVKKRGDKVFRHYLDESGGKPSGGGDNPAPILFGRKKNNTPKRFKYGFVDSDNDGVDSDNERDLEFYDYGAYAGGGEERYVPYDDYVDSLLDPQNNKQYSLKIRSYITHEGRRVPYLSTTGILDWEPMTKIDEISRYLNIEDEFTAEKVKAETKAFIDEYKDEIPGSPKLSRLVADRIQFLSSQITEIIERRSTENIEEHLPYLKQAFKWVSEDERERGPRSRYQTDGGYIFYSRSRDQLYMNFQAGVYSPNFVMSEYEKDGNLDRYDIKVESDFFLKQDPGENVTFRYCNEIPTSETISRLSIGERPGNNFTKREAWASFLFDKIAKQFRSPKRASNLNQEEKADILRLLAESSYEQITDKVMEQIVFSLGNSRFFNVDYSDELDDRISGNPIFTRSCVTNKFGLSEASSLSFDRVILGDPATEIALEASRPENSPYNRDFDTPGPFEKALQTIAVKAFIRACLVEIMLKGGIAYASWDIGPIINDEFFKDYIFENIETQLDESPRLKNIWKPTLEKSESISSPREALKVFIRGELKNLPTYSREIFNPDRPTTDFSDWAYGETLPLVDWPTYKHKVENIAGNETTVGFSFSGERRGLPYSFLGQRGFHLEEYVYRVSISDQSKQKIQDYELPKFPGSASIPYFCDKLQEWWDLAQRQVREQISALEGLQGDALSTRIDSELAIMLSGVELDHRIRLMLLEVPEASGYPLTGQKLEDVSANPGPVQQVIEKYFGTKDELADRSRSVRKGYINARLGDDGRGPSVGAVSVDLVRTSRDISPSSCANLWTGSTPGIIESLKQEDTRRHMRQRISQKEDFDFVLGTVFPVRRFMSMASIYSTSVLSGYSSVPNVLNATKGLIAAIAETAATPITLRPQIDQAALQEFLTKNFPSDPSDPSCFALPDIGTEFFVKYFNDLWDLFKQLPSILLRGIALQLDPAYKEMRNHYLNCDIENLRIDYLAGETVDDTLVNGLHLYGKEHRENAGKYATLFSAPIDYYYAFSNPWKFPKRMEKTILKVISYIYSGSRPFVDLSNFYKIPCLEINENYHEGEKYDFGKYGRYGHPISPFGLFALMTPQLTADKRMKRGKCKPTPTNPCEDIDDETT